MGAAVLVIAAAGPLFALRPSDQAKSANSKAVWMTVSSLKTGQDYYLEVSEDGRAVLREENAKSVVTRRGTIPVQLIKDFLRETENSEVIATKNIQQHKAVFYKGEMLKISAYISGELTLTEAPLDKFGEAFSYAFGELHKAVLKLPVETGVKSFLRAEPLEGEALDNFKNQASKDGEIKTVETYDVQKVKPLMSAIKDTNRLIPLENDEDVKHLEDFINTHQLYGLRTLFYLPSTRGFFKCEVLEAARQSGAKEQAPGKKAPATKKPAKKKRAPAKKE